MCPNVCVECHNVGMVNHPYLVKLLLEENYQSVHDTLVDSVIGGTWSN